MRSHQLDLREDSPPRLSVQLDLREGLTPRLSVQLDLGEDSPPGSQYSTLQHKSATYCGPVSGQV